MNKKILVVDDESVMRRVVAYALEAIQINVVTAEDGAEALELAENHPFALALVDINLPDMDGFEVIQRLREMPHMADVPMIIFTARDHPSDENHALKAGAVGFLYKPFSTQALRDLVTRHLGD